MLKVASRAVSLAKTPISVSLPAFSTCPTALKNVDPVCVLEAPKIDNRVVLTSEDERRVRANQTATIPVPTKMDLTPINGVPEEHIYTRRVRIFQPAKNAMQSGTSNVQHWVIEFDNRQRWENPLMGWTSSGDPHSNLKVAFPTSQEAINHCEKNGWQWFIEGSYNQKEFKPKNYAVNFSWNRRTRVSTK